MKYIQMVFIKGISLLSLFAVQVFLTRTISVEDFGRFSYLVSIATIVNLFIIWGLDRYVIKRIAILYESNSLQKIKHFLFGVYSVFFINLVAVFLVFSLLFYFEKFLIVDASYNFFIILLAFLLGISKISSSVNKALGEVLISEISFNVIRPVAFLLFISITYHLFRPPRIQDTLVLLSFSYLLSFFISSLVNRKKIRSAPQFKKGVLKSIYAGSFIFFIIGLGIPLLSNIDILVLGSLTSKENLAYYVVATKITSLVLMGLVSANLLIAPKLPVYHEKKDYMSMGNLIRQNNIFILAISIIPMSVVYFLPELILGIFGQQYKIAKEMLQILLIGQVINVACGPVILVCMMCDLQQKVVPIILIGSAILALGCILLVPNLGLYGAAISNVIAYSFVNITLAFIVYNKLGVNPTLFNVFSRVYK